MKFGRVLVTTALVAVLASSLFSGWVTRSPSPFKPPVAQAETDSLPLTKEQAVAWWAGFGTHNGVGISISEWQDTPPHFTLPADSTNDRNRPELIFTLAAIHGTYTSYLLGYATALSPVNLSRMGSNVAWTIWSAKTSDGSTVPNLIAVGDNKGALGAGASHWEVYWIQDPSSAVDGSAATSNPSDSDKVVSLVMNGDGGGSGTDTYQNLYRYLFDEPISGDDCSGGREFTTGPKLGDPPAPVKLTRSGRQIETLNSNCINETPSGWGPWWGITNITSQAGDATGGCSITGIIGSVTNGIGMIFVRLIGCMLDYLVSSIADQLKDYMSTVGSISMKNVELIPKAMADNGNPIPDASTDTTKTTKTPVKIDQHLVGDFESELKAKDGVIRQIWGISMSVVNVVVILALLAIAFANILHLNINTYAAKKALPALVIGVVMANASLLLISFLADVANAVSVWAADIGTNCAYSGDGPGRFESMNCIPNLLGSAFPNALGSALIAPIVLALATGATAAAVTGGAALPIVLIIGGAIVIYYIFLLIAFLVGFIKRIVILYFLVMVSPVAFVAYGVPSFQQYFFKWWDSFLRYLFLFPIILFGMAMTVLLANKLGVAQMTNIFTVPGIVSIALVLSAGSLVIKLPKIITKGAIDAGALFKKAIGAAPAIMGGAKLAHGAGTTWQANKLQQRRKELIPKIARASTAAEKAALTAQLKQLGKKRIGVMRSADKWQKKFETGQGLSTLFGRPELLKDAYDARVKRMQKNDYIAAMTKTHGIPGMIRGEEEEAIVQRELGLTELKDATTPGKKLAWIKTLGKGHLERVYDKKNDDKNLEKIWGKRANNDPVKMEMLRQEFGEVQNRDDMIKYLKSLGVANPRQWKIGDLMKAGSLESVITRDLRRVRFFDKGDPYAVDAEKISQVDPRRTGGVPFGTAPAGANAGGGTNGAAYQQVMSDQAQRAIDQASNIRSEVAPEVHTAAQEIASQWKDALTDSTNFSQSDLEALKEKTQAMLSGALTIDDESIKSRLSNITDPSTFADITENLVHALNAGIHEANFNTPEARTSLESHMGDAYRNEQAIHEAGLQIEASINPAEIAELLQGSQEEVINRLATKFGGQIETLAKQTNRAPSQLDPARFAQILKESLQQVISGPKSTSLKSAIISALSTHAKEANIQGSSQVRQIEQAIQRNQRGDTAQTGPTEPSSPPVPPTPDSPTDTQTGS
ncbi:MAG: hypothetical protein Q7K33_03640 [Candidatus Berkelbacteria bacterium]|nr:hypothetical protein [Candidatus Berkelbacteria bacterium]